MPSRHTLSLFLFGLMCHTSSFAVLPATVTTISGRLICVHGKYKNLSSQNKHRLSNLEISGEELSRVRLVIVTGYFENVIGHDDALATATKTASYLTQTGQLSKFATNLSKERIMVEAHRLPLEGLPSDSFDGLKTCGADSVPVYIKMLFERNMGEKNKPNSSIRTSPF